MGNASVIHVQPQAFEQFDVSACENEPIHIPGSIQPHGALFVVDPADGTVLQAAVGNGQLDVTARHAVGRPIGDVLPPLASLALGELDRRLPAQGTMHLGMGKAGDLHHHIVAHRADGCLIVEAEEATSGDPGSFSEVYPHVRQFIEGLQSSATVEDLAALGVREVRRITGLDRALIYKFDAAWNGEVVAEDRNDRLPSYLGLHFPASDIPPQARELYRLNRLRLIAAADYSPTPIHPRINPLSGRPIDLSFAVLRSVSPVHLEYMRNMGTMASMSISLLREGRLWGLISCHNRAAARVPYYVRTACDFIGQVLSMQLAAREFAQLAERRNLLRSVQAKLLARMAGAEHFIDGLIDRPEDLLALTGADGAAVVSGGAFKLIGTTPDEGAVRRLVDWLSSGRRDDIVATDHLAAAMPGAESMKDHASGVLAISFSQLHHGYLIWFRPEVIRSVAWGGDPGKPGEPSGSGMRLHPRKSFERWQETIKMRSRPWEAAEVEAAAELRNAIVDIVLRKAEEMAALSERLTRSNQELEAFSYSVSHDLRAPFRHIVGYAQLLKQYEGGKLSERGVRFIDTIVESAVSAGTLVDDLLSFSQMGHATLSPVKLDMNELFREVRRTLASHHADAAEWRIGDLPPVHADPRMMRLVVQNLLDNALKFSRARTPPVIEVGATVEATENTYFVRDNGTGFDMAYVGKLFGVFQRLHRVEDFEGTGIGLANVKRIIERHRGRVWAEGSVDRGATFFFALPRVV